MTRYSRLLAAFALALATTWADAQTNGSNSSYSRFGLGTLDDQSQGFNKGMAGVGIGLRSGKQVNMANPASYSAIDSLSFIFDVNAKANFGWMKSNGISAKTTNCAIDNVNAGLQLRRGIGLSFGFAPYTSIGYSFSEKPKAIATDPLSAQIITAQSTYSGNGGLHQAYIGVGAKVFKDISLGANVSFLWGSCSHSAIGVFAEGGTTNANVSGLYSVHEASIRTYKIDLGAQYPIRLTPQDWLTVGATAGLGHKIKGEATLKVYTEANTDPQPTTAYDAFDLPYSVGLGLGWQHQDKLMVGLDARHEMWSKCHTPVYNYALDIYEPKTGDFCDRTKVAAGAQFTPDQYDRHYWNRIQYRMGAHFSTPYLKINGAKGPREYGISIGAGLPITNNYNNRSMANISVQWMRRAPTTTAQITEDYLMLNFGLTFNEHWFMKYKIK